MMQLEIRGLRRSGRTTLALEDALRRVNDGANVAWFSADDNALRQVMRFAGNRIGDSGGGSIQFLTPMGYDAIMGHGYDCAYVDDADLVDPLLLRAIVPQVRGLIVRVVETVR